MKDPGSRFGWKEWALRALLRVYGPEFRASYEEELVQAHRDLWREAKRDGKNRLRLLVWCVADTLINAVRLQVFGRTPRSTSAHQGTQPRRGNRMERIWNDARYALRTLLRNPAFAVVAIATLGLGIGANAAIFGVVDAVLLRPLPFAEADGLVWLSNRYHPSGTTGAISAPEFWEYRETDAAFENAAVVRPTAVNLTGLEPPLRVQGVAVSPTYFDVLRVRPALGRAFSPQEELPETEPVVVISDGLWRRAFSADRAILGRQIRMNGVARTIVGVMAADHPPLGPYLFSGTAVDFWIPATLTPALFDASSVEVHNLNVVARLTEGSTVANAEEALLPAVERIERLYPGISNAGQRDVQVLPLRDRIVGDIGSTLFILLGTVGLVLLVACVNVTNLLLARGEERAGEVSVRIALGAGRGRVLSHALMEGGLVGTLGGALGVLLATAAQRWLVTIAPPGLPRLDEVGLSPVVLAFTFAVSVLAGLLAAAVPARRMLRGNLLIALNSAGRSRGFAGKERARFRRVLVVGEVAAAVVLVAAAGLLGRSLLALRTVDPGFETSDLYMVEINASRTAYPDLDSVRRLYANLLASTQALPSVSAASASWQTPFQGGMSDWPVKTNEPDADWVGADPNWVSHSYFETHGMRLVEGRLFDPSDLDRPEGAVILGETAARRLWPAASPIGRRVNINFDEPVWREVVGVVSDVRARGLGQEPRAQTYLPFSDVPFGPIPSLTLTVRTSLAAEALRRELVATLASIDPEIPIGPVQSMTGQLSASLSRERFMSVLVGVFGAIALMLGTIGVYGLLAHTVSGQRREIGLRIALGAHPGEVLKGVVLHATSLGALGVAVGLAASLLTTRLLEGFLYGVTGTDLPTLATVSIVVLGAAAVASYFPARSAAAVDPMTALRED